MSTSDRLTDQTYQQAVALLREASSPSGFVASPAFEHYAVIWGRDAAIAALGALETDDDRLVETSISTVRTLAETQTGFGQIAAVVRPKARSWDFAEGGAVDVTAWYVILAGAAYRRTREARLARELWPSVSRAIRWLRNQDVTGTGLVSVAPATDWMDSSLTRSGRTLHVNVLLYWASAAAAELAEALSEGPPVDTDDLRWRLNTLFWPNPADPIEELYRGLRGKPEIPSPFPHGATVQAFASAASDERSHYVSHVVHAHFDENCDVLANLLAVTAGVAGEERSRRILRHLAKRGGHRPFPTRSWLDPIEAGNSPYMRIREVERYLDPRWHNKPNTYHNGGAWPYIGGFHVLASTGAGRLGEAADLLGRLARANHEGRDGKPWGFFEWFDGRTGEPGGASRQTWNAGTFVLAWHALRDAESTASRSSRPWQGFPGGTPGRR